MTPPRPKRPRGRPPLDPTGAHAIELGISLTESALTAVISLAASAHCTPQDIIRRALAQFVRDAQRPPRARPRQRVTVTRRLGV